MINIYLNPKVIGLNANHSNRKKARNFEEKLFEKRRSHGFFYAPTTEKKRIFVFGCVLLFLKVLLFCARISNHKQASELVELYFV